MNNNTTSFWKAFVLTCTAFLFTTFFYAQPSTTRSLDIDVGLGISASYYENVDVMGTGFFVSGEYALPLTSWFGFRPYASLLMTWTDKDSYTASGQTYSMSSRAFMTGAKARLVAPIPWVAPYIESGVGLSLGSFENVSQFDNIRRNGVLYHIPLTLGLILGPERNFDFNLSYYFHPQVNQFNGAVAIGLSIPLK